MNNSKKYFSVSIIAFIISIILVVSGCENRSSSSTSNFTYKQIGALSVRDSFSYRTTELVEIEALFSTAYPGVTFILFGSSFDVQPDNSDLDDLYAVGSATTDEEGRFSVELSVPTRFSHVVLEASYLGLPNRLYLPITTANKASFSLVPTSQFASRSLVLESPTYPPVRVIKTYEKEGLIYLDTYDADGRPTNLTSRPLDASFLADINTSLPEYKSVPVHNPEYLEKGKEATLKIVDKSADVWVTFVHEGAAFRNSLGFYTYPTANGPPESVDDLDIHIIFPNASLQFSSGMLRSGDTAYIGRFDEGTSIGWVLYANGWDDYRKFVRINQGRFFSDAQYNPEPLEAEKLHTVVLYDANRQVLVTGIEDLLRTGGRGDNDFNDLVFYALVNPVESVGNLDNFTEIKRAVDTDGDGVIDSEDHFPNDARYSTLEKQSGTIAYEDMWPKLGDYDFNDWVVSYTYYIYGNSQNRVPRIDMEFTPLASGAGFQNGLALALPFVSANSMTLTYDSVPNGGGLTVVPHSTASTNGVSIIIMEKVKSVIGDARKEYLNTDAKDPDYVKPKTVSFSIEFKQPVSRKTLGVLPFDVYLLANNSNPDDQNHEIHLPDFAPTPLLQPGLLGTHNDTSDASKNRYFKTKNNLPWALHIPGNWLYPIERVSIVDAYQRFGDWAESNGQSYQNWYMDEKYMDKEKLYIR